MILLKFKEPTNSTALKIQSEFTFKYNLPNALYQTIGKVFPGTSSHMG